MIGVNFTRVTGNPNHDIKNPLRPSNHNHGFTKNGGSFLSRFSFVYILAVVGLFYLIRLLNHSS